MRPRLSQLHQTGATTGQAVVWDGTKWAPGTPGGSSADMDATKVSELAPTDAAIWLPANLGDVTVSALAADRAVILAPNPTGWEAGVVQEPSPWVYRGKFHMLYTGGWTSAAIGYASADHPLGPWTKNAAAVIGNGVGGMANPTAHHNAYIEGDTVYAYYPDNINGGNLKVATASAAAPTVWTTVGTALAVTATATGIVNSYLYKRAANDYVLMFESKSTSGPQWQIGYATGTSPQGPFTVVSFPLPSLQIGTGMYGGPRLSRRSDGTWVLVYHAGTTASLPTDIYRATSSNLTTWTPVTTPYISRVIDPPEHDQVADFAYLVADFGGFAMWDGMNNVTPAGSILVSQVRNVGAPRWLDGTTWQTAWPGSGELLMQDGVSSPPVPLETEDGTDWLYEG